MTTMDTLLHKTFADGITLAVVKSDINMMRKVLSINDLRDIERTEFEALSNDKRRRERLTTLHILHNVLNITEPLNHAPDGRPTLSGSNANISISHTADGVVGVAVHPANAVGIDIEERSRNFCRVASRFLSPKEQAYITGNEQYGIAWCAKEAAYKAMQIPAVDFAEHIEICAFDVCTDAALTLHFRHPQKTQTLTLSKISVQNYWIVFGKI